MALNEDDLIGLLNSDENNLRYNEDPVPSGSDTDFNIDPSTGPEDDRGYTDRMLSATFEGISKNIASYPFEIESSNMNYFTKKYYMPDNEETVLTVDSTVEGLIKMTAVSNKGIVVSGVRYVGLAKTIEYNDTDIVGVYSFLDVM